MALDPTLYAAPTYIRGMKTWPQLESRICYVTLGKLPDSPSLVFPGELA